MPFLTIISCIEAGPDNKQFRDICLPEKANQDLHIKKATHPRGAPSSMDHAPIKIFPRRKQ
eukprot:756905-Hanusia_phi.AAC.1